ncbi:PGPGW domain-containing protein [Salinibacterium sp. SWN139]|uniref:PGPGW domain-containing protein n=1 Tax=Salinibacterium sp. SWN139 TaxID=2792055 RepID=UPI0018CE94E7|nr:PGPGW domain-containing protein [Salinibacterium sp. SWN139]MBH0053084.1 PGPGW domain-containing protein [Salinibacterium sp. SWN139]
MSQKRTVAARAGVAVGHAASSAAHGTREAIRKNPKADRVYRTTVGVVGGTTVALGVVLIPLPGPGSLVAIGGLALLGTEFEMAKKASGKANALARKALATANEKRQRRAAVRAAADSDTDSDSAAAVVGVGDHEVSGD